MVNPTHGERPLRRLPRGALPGWRALLVAAGKRHLIVIDGLPACAALLVASRIAPAVMDYVVFSRSHPHPGLTAALDLFEATALLELGMSSTDGTGAVLAWPLIHSAAALLTEVAEGEMPGSTYPADLNPMGADIEDAHVLGAYDDDVSTSPGSSLYSEA
ncbi:nicotinate-nucleotide--dimethylbenzimidazole phosphoribosyltransferase [mine drainage metagenome]|uniref:Nicotinate-nucleotide--dimethylbenzimidazole phosphoribosyltransferase n=1 Tax=mine drainage metagenome TaxID=410659 RepID=A0A1J5QSS5_9ZZZZ